MTSLAKPLPAPRGITTGQRMEGSLGSGQKMETEEIDARPKPPLRPKPKVLPKPLPKSLSQDTGSPLPPSIPWSPKSPISEVPSAEKINQLTGPKPYGAATSGSGIRRPSFTLKRQTSESLPVDEACSSAPALGSRAPGVPSPPRSPSAGAPALPTGTLDLVRQTEVDSVTQEPPTKEDVKDARPPVQKKPAVSFRVKPVLGAPKPGRFPGTTVEQILAKMEEDKSTCPTTAPGTDRSWAQRTSMSFDGGSRFGSTTYSSFRRVPSGSEDPREDEADKESQRTPKSAGLPASPLFQATVGWGAKKQTPAPKTAAESQESVFPSDQSPERRTSPAPKITDHTKKASSSLVTPEHPTSAAPPGPLGLPFSVHPDDASESTSPAQNPPWSHPNEVLEHLQGKLTSSVVNKDAGLAGPDKDLVSTLPVSGVALGAAEPSASEKHSSVSLEKELTSSLLLGGIPHGSAEHPQTSKASGTASVESDLSPNDFGGGGSLDGGKPSTVSVERELVSSLLLGGAPLGLTAAEPPSSKTLSLEEPKHLSMGSPSKVESSSPLREEGNFPGSVSRLAQSSYMKDFGDTPAMADRSLGGYDWNLSESFEWSSPAKSSEWAMRRENPSAPSIPEQTEAQSPSNDEPAQELKIPHGITLDQRPELATIEGREDIDQTRRSVTAVSELLEFSSPKARLQERPSDISVDDSYYEMGRANKVEPRSYSGYKVGDLTLGKLEEGGAILVSREREAPVERVSEVGLGPGALVAEEFTEEHQDEASGPRSGVGVFQAEEVFEPHSLDTKVYEVESEWDRRPPRSAGLGSERVDARGLMEPLRPVLLSDPAAEPCVMYHGFTPKEYAVPSWEDDSCLDMLRTRGERPLEGSPSGTEDGANQHRMEDQEDGEGQTSRTSMEQSLEVSDFDPMRGDPGEEKAHGRTTGTDSHWLQELLSPTEDLETKSVETPASAESEHGLLGWSQKDLQSEFGIEKPKRIRTDSPVGAELTGLGKSVWDDEYGFGGTNQSREVDIGTTDWTRKHGNGESDWRRDSDNLNSDIGELGQREEPGLSHRDWSIKPSMVETYLSEEPEISHRDWSIKPSIGETEQSEEPGIGHRDWSIKPSIGESEQSEEPGIGHRDWSIKPSMVETYLSEEPEISHRDWSIKPSIGETEQSEEPGISHRDWSIKPSMGETDQSEYYGKSHSDWSIKPSIGETDQREASPITHTDWSIKHNIGDTDQGTVAGFSTQDWATKNTFGATDHGEESGIGTGDWSLKPSFGGRDQTEGLGLGNKDWSMTHSLGDVDQGRDSGVGTKDLSMGGEGRASEISSHDMSLNPNIGGADKSREYESSSMDWSFGHSVGGSAQREGSDSSSLDWSIKPSIIDQSTEPDLGQRVLGDVYSIALADQGGEVGFGGMERSMDIEGMERSGETVRARESGDGETDRRTEFEIRETGQQWEISGMERERDTRIMEREREIASIMRAQEIASMERAEEIANMAREREMASLERAQEIASMERAQEIANMEREREKGGMEREREMGDGEMERTWQINAHGMERTSEIGEGELNSSYSPDVETSEHRDAQSNQYFENLSLSPHDAVQPEGPSSILLKEMLGRGELRQSPRLERPASLQSGQSQDGEDKQVDSTPSGLPEGDLQVKPEEEGSPIQSQTDLEARRVQSDEADTMDGAMLTEQEGETAEEMEDVLCPEVDFSFLEEAEVLDSTLYRTRASLNRKRGHRAPTARPGAALNFTECDSDAWMFQDSTEPKVPRPDSSDEETQAAAAVEEEPSQSSPSKKSPISQGKKLGIFAGFNPSALKAKLKSRKASEEGEQPKSPRQKDTNFQRSKSCKLPAESAKKPPALLPKPEKAAGSESSSPQWLQALKIKKKPQK